MSASLRVIVDERERASGVPRLLKDLGLKVGYRMLAIGDYILPSGYVIERKEVHDFVRSLFSGRLFTQASSLVECYDKAIVVVEGDLQSVIRELSNPRSIWGALTTLAFSYNLRIFFTNNREQTADLIYTLTKRENNIEMPQSPTIYKKIRKKSSEEIKITILSDLPGIGPKLAKNMINHFGSLRKTFSASTAELILVKGIGRTKAEKVIQILDSKQDSNEKSLEQKKLTE